MFSNSNICLSDPDFNIDQNNRDYDFFHNQAALPCMMFLADANISPMARSAVGLRTTSGVFVTLTPKLLIRGMSK